MAKGCLFQPSWFSAPWTLKMRPPHFVHFMTIVIILLRAFNAQTISRPSLEQCRKSQDWWFIASCFPTTRLGHISSLWKAAQSRQAGLQYTSINFGGQRCNKEAALFLFQTILPFKESKILCTCSPSRVPGLQMESSVDSSLSYQKSCKTKGFLPCGTIWYFSCALLYCDDFPPCPQMFSKGSSGVAIWVL